ncbi:hypothetical protein GGX14DRAFT_387549 [Mycena pura]|uniref:Uncharacterized protein n=1 Tax=Mycena pura TaxID=153505 RepID=A0AAD6YLV1_9AGAR|nr:hypothetical protein GGX14DRAFT_387549 [Mycena pura]
MDSRRRGRIWNNSYSGVRVSEVWGKSRGLGPLGRLRRLLEPEGETARSRDVRAKWLRAGEGSERMERGGLGEGKKAPKAQANSTTNWKAKRGKRRVGEEKGGICEHVVAARKKKSGVRVSEVWGKSRGLGPLGRLRRLLEPEGETARSRDVRAKWLRAGEGSERMERGGLGEGKKAPKAQANSTTNWKAKRGKRRVGEEKGGICEHVVAARKKKV